MEKDTVQQNKNNRKYDKTENNDMGISTIEKDRQANKQSVVLMLGTTDKDSSEKKLAS